MKLCTYYYLNLQSFYTKLAKRLTIKNLTVCMNQVFKSGKSAASLTCIDDQSDLLQQQDQDSYFLPR